MQQLHKLFAGSVSAHKLPGNCGRRLCADHTWHVPNNHQWCGTVCDGPLDRRTNWTDEKWTGRHYKAGQENGRSFAATTRSVGQIGRWFQQSNVVQCHPWCSMGWAHRRFKLWSTKKAHQSTKSCDATNKFQTKSSATIYATVQTKFNRWHCFQRSIQIARSIVKSLIKKKTKSKNNLLVYRFYTRRPPLSSSSFHSFVPLQTDDDCSFANKIFPLQITAHGRP